MGLLSGVAGADTILLQNGRALDGIITAESTNRITLDIGVGEVTLKPSQVRSIRRSSPEEADRIRDAWRDQHFNHPRYVPEELRAWSERWERLLRHRAEALRAHLAEPGRRARLDALAQEGESAQAELATALRELPAAAPAPSSPALDAYNQRVARANFAQGRIATQRREWAEIRSALDAGREATSAYIRELQDFADDLEKADLAPSADGRRYLGQLREHAAGLLSDLKQVRLPVEDSRRHAVLNVEVNGVAGRFMLDTGASRVVLAPSFAQRAGVRTDAQQTLDVTLANGQVVPAMDVTLDRVETAGVSAENVPGLILKDPPEKDLDGLLGMSFLGEFVLRYDAPRQQVTLTQFDPPSDRVSEDPASSP